MEQLVVDSDGCFTVCARHRDGGSCGLNRLMLPIHRHKCPFSSQMEPLVSSLNFLRNKLVFVQDISDTPVLVYLQIPRRTAFKTNILSIHYLTYGCYSTMSV